MTQTLQQDADSRSKFDYHREEAMHFAEKAEALCELIGPHGNADRELNQKIGGALKLADVHARLALAISNQELAGPTVTVEDFAEQVAVIVQRSASPMSQADMGREIQKAIKAAERVGGRA